MSYLLSQGELREPLKVYHKTLCFGGLVSIISDELNLLSRAELLQRNFEEQDSGQLRYSVKVYTHEFAIGVIYRRWESLRQINWYLNI